MSATESGAGERGLREAVAALLATWSDFDHDAVSCSKYDCGDCTMLNACHDLSTLLAAHPVGAIRRSGKVAAAIALAEGWVGFDDSHFYGDALLAVLGSNAAEDFHPLRGDYRPVVVIDPEDTEQVERLINALADAETHKRRDYIEPNSGAMQAALREFANPKPPKPEEPTGLGAVVEDVTGTKWIRHDSVAIRTRWLNTDDCETRFRTWDDLDIQRVLSEGVTI